MNEQKPEYIVFMDDNEHSATQRINKQASEGYEVAWQSSAGLPGPDGDDGRVWTTYTLRLRHVHRQVSMLPQLIGIEQRLNSLDRMLTEVALWVNYQDALQPKPNDQAPSLADQLAAAHSRSAGLEIRVCQLEAAADQRTNTMRGVLERIESLEAAVLRLVAANGLKAAKIEKDNYVSSLMTAIRQLQAYEKDDRKAICENSGGLSVLEREVKHLRANLEANIERVDRLLAIKKATEEVQKVEEEAPWYDTTAKALKDDGHE